MTLYTQMDINELINYLTCPLTKKLFYNPVTTDDGHTYERAALEKFLKTDNKSLISDIEIGKNIFKNIIVKQLVDEFMLSNPDIKRYEPDETDTNYEIVDCIYNKQFEKLLQYKNFDLDSIVNQTCYNINCFDYLFRYCNINEILQHIINNCKYLEVCDIESNNFLHYACKYKKFEIIKLLFSKKIMIESPNNRSEFPIHYACRYCNFDIIKFMVDNSCYLQHADDNGNTPLHIACKYNCIESVKYLIDNGCDVNYYNNKALTPIDVANKNINNLIINYLKEKNIKLENQIDVQEISDSDSD